MISYSVMNPFWPIGGTSSHITEIVVEDSAIAVTFSGGLAGSGKDHQMLPGHQYIIRSLLYKITHSNTYQPHVLTQSLGQCKAPPLHR